MTDETHQGGCLCGAITYHVKGRLRPVVACHCLQCQKTSGSFVAATSALRDDIDIRGPIAWYQSSPEARRGFCGICGSSLFWDGGGDRMSIMIGTLEAPTHTKLAGHIYCITKGDWFEITDGLPQYPEDDGAALVAWPK
jgi:hypothetical protein